MKVYVNRAVVDGPYGGGNGAVRALFQHASDQVEFTHIDPDVVLCMGIDPEGGHPGLEHLVELKRKGARFKLVLRVNTCDARRGHPRGSNEDRRLLDASPHLDGTIFVSEWMRDYFLEQGWKCGKNTVIVNGVDQEAFKPQATR
jgi:glycosyltransferase involved in cell wall biosynthesis